MIKDIIFGITNTANMKANNHNTEEIGELIVLSIAFLLVIGSLVAFYHYHG